MTSKLQDYITFKNGKKRPKDIGKYPVYGGNGILSYANTYNAEKCIIIGRVGAYCGCVYKSNGKCWISDNAILGINKEHSDLNYLYYFLSSLQLNKRSIGSGQPLMTQDILNNINVNIPPLETQQKIAKILSAIDDKIELNNKINANLEEQAQAIFKSWFVDFEPFDGVMPDDWEKGTFNKIIDTTISGDWGKDKQTGNYTEKVYCIRGADIPNIREGSKGKMPERYININNFKDKKLSDGDLVVEISGGSPTQSTGRIVAITSFLQKRYDNDLICTNFCKAIKPKENYSMFVYYYWIYLYKKNVFFSYENGTTGIKNLDINSILEQEPIVIPSTCIIENFNKACTKIHNIIYTNGYENEKLQQLRDTLLPKLMNGEIDVEKVNINKTAYTK